jgi:hypothetical protein
MGAGVYAVHGVGVHRPAGSGGQAGTPDLALLPRALRRGLSAGMKFAIAAAGQALTQARAGGAAGEGTEVPIVYGSAGGETSTAIELLTSIVAARESSPVSFRHSVHNAAPGLLSIALGTLASSTAVAAGDETLLAVLLEAAALLNEGAPAVLLVVAEEGASPLLSPAQSAGAGAGAVAWVLGPAARPRRGDGARVLAFVGAPTRAAHALPPEAGAVGDPLQPAWRLADSIAQLAGGPDAAASDSVPVTTVALSPGQSWQLQVAGTCEALGQLQVAGTCEVLA